MAVSMSPKQKVYQEVLQEIRKLIDENKLKTGDKLPSERELSEKLGAGRSSVREALRAMELLGLIETKHGEGTFLSAYRPYQSVEVLASFILQETSTRNDLLQTKKKLEKEAAKMAYERLTDQNINELEKLTTDLSDDMKKQHLTYFTYLFTKTENLLLTRIWRLMEEYSHTMDAHYYDQKFYVELINIFRTRKYPSIESLFEDTVIIK
ncbi:GntR family transcriptional regulator, transcriptional repressor for pyruvate dehydrogenase complex [Oceanobacillus limi]|uniref:GntR family transcriptional regulator, transcriptional repressor for pyruvate dehydrogenase complex n=1 Tax=Oceanobacillus limi TaxID=930131 RepID=A0A1I0EJA9_9BACI|nr:GntR family transcriptional regulator [Oceanobacillus limi]SET44752.1 GntR family transcriptional regulator, transcriptional repressor for pyruvate dehydrogenase complex [Oceanobacillus limi]